MQLIRYKDASGETHFGGRRRREECWYRLRGNPFADFELTSQPAEVTNLLSPIQPPAIWCIGLNYRQHAAETNSEIPDYPVVFAKGINSVQHPGCPIEIPRSLRSDEVDYECELAVVIGKCCKNVSREAALEYVLGYTCANDVSSRDWQIAKGGGQWCRGKTFDTFCPLGPCLTTSTEITNPNALRIETILNGDKVQRSNTSDMIFDVSTLIAFLSGSTTLLPGTVILTGTPQGVGMAQSPPRWLRDGDELTITIEGIGDLRNPVRHEQIRSQSHPA